MLALLPNRVPDADVNFRPFGERAADQKLPNEPRFWRNVGIESDDCAVPLPRVLLSRIVRPQGLNDVVTKTLVSAGNKLVTTATNTLLALPLMEARDPFVPPHQSPESRSPNRDALKVSTFRTNPKKYIVLSYFTVMIYKVKIEPETCGLGKLRPSKQRTFRCQHRFLHHLLRSDRSLERSSR